MSSNPVSRNPSQPLDQRQRLLLRVLRARSGGQLRRILQRLHPADVAPLFPLLKPDEKNNLLEVLFEMQLAGRTLSELDDDTLGQVLGDFPDSQLAVVLRRLPADDAVDLLDQLDSERRTKVLSTLEPSLASRLHNLMTYGQDTAGGIMDPDVIFFQADQTVDQTLAVIRQLAENRRPYYLYVTDERGHLLGWVKLWQLITAGRDQVLRSVMKKDVISVQVDMPQEEVARIFGRYDLPVMPVRDGDGLLVGIITVDDVIDVIEEEASEDLYRLGGLPRPETLGMPLTRSLRFRLPWLGMSLIGAGFAAWVLASHQVLIAKYAVIVAFMHIIAATGGDAGRQTLTVVSAAMATGEIDLWRRWKVVGKQVLLGLINGLISGAFVGLVALLLEGEMTLALIVFVAQVANQTVAAATACSIPLLFAKIGLDPTLGTSNLVVTMSDLLGFALFLTLVDLLL